MHSFRVAEFTLPELLLKHYSDLNEILPILFSKYLNLNPNSSKNPIKHFKLDIEHIFEQSISSFETMKPYFDFDISDIDKTFLFNKFNTCLNSSACNLRPMFKFQHNYKTGYYNAFLKKKIKQIIIYLQK